VRDFRGLFRSLAIHSPPWCESGVVYGNSRYTGHADERASISRGCGCERERESARARERSAVRVDGRKKIYVSFGTVLQASTASERTSVRPTRRMYNSVVERRRGERRATRRVFAFARATSRMNHDYAITVVMAWIKPLPTLMSFFL